MQLDVVRLSVVQVSVLAPAVVKRVYDGGLWVHGDGGADSIVCDSSAVVHGHCGPDVVPHKRAYVASDSVGARDNVFRGVPILLDRRRVIGDDNVYGMVLSAGARWS